MSSSSYTSQANNAVDSPSAFDTSPTIGPVCNLALPPEVKMCVEYISRQDDPRLVLLRDVTVILWLFGHLTLFLPKIELKNKTTDEKKYKILEDEWGRTVIKNRRPDLKLDKQWTGIYGQHLCEELYLLQGKVGSKPLKRNTHQPDLEVDDHMVEAKTETYYTSGTAGEKILGVPFKYADVPDLYNKPLKIICIGGAEQNSRENYRIFNKEVSAKKQKYIDFYKENGIEYVAATDMLLNIVRGSAHN